MTADDRLAALFFIFCAVLTCSAMIGTKVDYSGTSYLGNREYVECRAQNGAKGCKHLIAKDKPTPPLWSFE
jgi:hypothetical protein